LARVLRMPDVGADSDEGVLASWLVEESARFDAAQTIAYVETQDELFSVEAGRPGILLRALVAPGTTVDAGTPIGVLGEVWEQVHDVDALLVELGVAHLAAPVATSSLFDAGTPVAAGVPSVEDTAPVGARASTAEENLLAPVSTPRHYGIETLEERAEQATHAASADQPPNPFAVPDPLSVVAQEDPSVSLLEQGATVEVADPAEAQHHYLRVTVRADRLAALSVELERAGAPDSSVIDLVGRAVAGAHRQVPQVGVARIETDRAATPGIPVTYPGRFGVDEAAAVVPEGQAAALAVGSLRDEPVVDGTAVVAGKVMTLTLSIKPGRVEDAPAARWLGVLVALLERPEWMVE
jgi:pyruvate dehydrogenase E2 component (dihydrolipoamide acetyltransferase)